MLKKLFPVFPGLCRSNIYEVNLRQYTPEGSFSVFANHLPRLKEMGVDILWFMPLTPISLKNRKGSLGSYYAASDLTGINPEFGSPDDCKALFRQAQEMGFRIIIDWVANHTGWDHHWTITHPDYYKKEEETGDFKAASGMDDIIELDFENLELRKAMIGAMQYWIDEFGVDGFRCDLAFWVELDFWLEARSELRSDKVLIWFGEYDPLDHPGYYQAFDVAYTWTWMHKSEGFCKGNEPFKALLQTLDRYLKICNEKAIPAWFTANHDENSWNGTEFEKYGEHHLVLAVFSFTYPGIPLLYSGQELPNRKRLEFFEKDSLDWNRQLQYREFYMTLCMLRKHHPAFEENSVFEWIPGNAENLLMGYKRIKGKAELWTLLNFSNAELALNPLFTGLSGDYTNPFDNKLMNFRNVPEIKIPAYGYLLLEKVQV